MANTIDVEINWSPQAAADVLRQVDKMKRAFDELTEVVARDLAKEEQVAVRKFLGTLMGAVLSELSMPIEEKYPSLRSTPPGQE
jgi:hypothetical protein